MKNYDIDQPVKTVPSTVQKAWLSCGQQCRSLFDGLSSEYCGATIKDKLTILRYLDEQGVLSNVLGQYMMNYQADAPHVLDGLGHAVLNYRDHDFNLSVSWEYVLRLERHAIIVAGLRNALETNGIDRRDYHWLIAELEALNNVISA